MHELALTLDKEKLLVTRADGVAMESACAGGSRAFSATELLGASLGSCMAASLRPLLARHGADCGRLRVTVRLRDDALEQGFAVAIALPPVNAALDVRCRRAVAACPVIRAMNLPIDIHWQDC